MAAVCLQVEVAKLQLEVGSAASKAQEMESEAAKQRQRLEATQEEVRHIRLSPVLYL